MYSVSMRSAYFKKSPLGSAESRLQLRRVLHGLPLPRLRGGEHRIADVLRLERVAERGPARLVLGDRLDEIGDLVHEALGVADLQARHPPVLHVRLIAIRHVHTAPAADDALVVVAE